MWSSDFVPSAYEAAPVKAKAVIQPHCRDIFRTDCQFDMIAVGFGKERTAGELIDAITDLASTLNLVVRDTRRVLEKRKDE